MKTIELLISLFSRISLTSCTPFILGKFRSGTINIRGDGARVFPFKPVQHVERLNAVDGAQDRICHAGFQKRPVRTALASPSLIFHQQDVQWLFMLRSHIVQRPLLLSVLASAR